MGVETFHHLKKVLSSRGYSTAVGDEGGTAREHGPLRHPGAPAETRRRPRDRPQEDWPRDADGGCVVDLGHHSGTAAAQARNP